MPFVGPISDTTLVADGAPPPRPLAPDLMSTWGAAFRQDNEVVSVYRRLWDESFPPDPTYNPLPEIRDTPYFQTHADAFVGSRSAGETEQIKRRIDEEEADRRTLDAAGWSGTVAQLAAGVTSPTTWLVPGGEIVAAGRAGIAAARVGAAARLGAATGVGATGSEAILQTTHETRTAGESAMVIATGTLLGALLGPLAVSRMAPAERVAAENALHAERIRMAEHAGDTAGADMLRAATPETSGLAQAAGAAAADVRAMELVPFGLDKIPGWSRIARFIGTDLGIYSAKSLAAKRHFSTIAETALRFKQNLADEVTSPVVPLDREVRIRMETAQIQTQDEMKRLYSDYFFGDEAATAPYLRAEFQTRFGDSGGKLSPSEFGNEVASAMQKADVHDIPQVQQAAQFIRRTMIEPYAAKMEKANPDFVRKEFGPGESYFPYHWEAPKIAAERPKFVDEVVLPKLRSDQANAAAIKERLVSLNDELQSLNAKLSGKLSADEAVTLSRRHGELRAKIEAELGAWEGKSANEAKAALKAREKYAAESGRAADAPRLKQADDAIDATVKRIIKSDRDLSDLELRDKAEEIVDHILGTPIGRIPYDAHVAANAGPRRPDRVARGPLLARDFDMPYDMAKDYLSHDLEKVLGSWMRTMVPDTLLWERFPTEGPALTSVYRAIQEDYAALVREAKTPKERTRLNKEKDAVIQTFDGVLQRIRGTVNNTEGLSGRVAESVRRINQMTDLGFAAVTSIPDFAGPIFYHGLSSTFRDAWVPYLGYLAGSPELVRMSKRELRAMSVAAETENAMRGHALAEIGQVYHPRTEAERMLKAASDKYFLANVQAYETNTAKRMAGRVAMSQMLRAIEAETAGKATARQKTMLRESNIAPDMSRRIWEQFSKPEGGNTIDGVHLSNTANWTDEQAKMHFTAAIGRDVDKAVVTPGQEKPLWISTNAGSLLAQFKGFTMAATVKLVISNLQRSDAQALQGVIAAIGFGMLSYRMTTLLRGQQPHERPQDWVKEGINRAGLLGILEDVNMFAGKASRGQVDVYRLIGADKPLSRGVNRTILSALMGPTAGKIENIVRSTGAAATGEWNAGDTHAVRRLFPLQNLFMFQRALDELEAAGNRQFGIEERAR